MRGTVVNSSRRRRLFVVCGDGTTGNAQIGRYAGLVCVIPRFAEVIELALTLRARIPER